MTRPAPMDGDYGPRTAEMLHLFPKSDSYRRGYWEGKRHRLHSLEACNALVSARWIGGDYAEGYKMARQVRKHGIKKALRKAKR